MHTRIKFAHILALTALVLNASIALAQGSVDPADLDDQTVHPWNDLFQSPSGTNNSFTTSNRNQDNSALRHLEEGSRIANQASGKNNFNSLNSAMDMGDSNSYFGKFNSDPNSWCKDSSYGDDDNCIKDDKLFTLPYRPGQKISSFNTVGPVGAVTDIVNSQVYTNQMSMALLSPQAILAATMNLTEPGITAGLNMAMTNANSAFSHRMQVDDANIQRGRASPSGQIFFDMYENCLARYRAQGYSFPKAQSLCVSGDRASPSAQLLDAEPGTTMMNFKADPNHPSSQESGITDTRYNDGTEIKDNRIRALDYIFNLEQKYGPTDLAADDQKNSLIELRKSFEDFIGDVEFVIAPPQASGQLLPNVTNLPGTIEGTMAVSIRRIAPRLTPQKFFRNLVINRYRDYMALLRIECQYMGEAKIFDGVTAGGGGDDIGELPQTTSPTSYLDPSAVYSNFWGDSVGAHQLLIRLSTTGFQPSPKLFDATFGMFLDERTDKYDAGTADKLVLSCDNLGTGDGEPSNVFSLLSSGAADSKGRKLAMNTRERFRTAFSFSEKIAFGQYLGTLARAEDFVKDLTGGAMDSMVRKQLLDMIYSIAGTNNIRGAIDLNDRQLREASVPIVANFNYRNGLSSQGYQVSVESSGGNNDAAGIESPTN